MKFIAVICVILFSMGAWAGEGIFSYLYTSETTPAGTAEYEQTQTLRTGKARGNYTAIDLRNAFEYGITDEFQAEAYLNSSYINSSNQYDPENVSNNFKSRNEYNIDGVSIEFIYRLLSPYKDGIGLALYFEPELSVRDRMTGEDNIERALETRLILQENFLDDTLITATNFMLEPEWEKVDGLAVKELWAEWTLGAVYRFKPNWFTGLEFRNHMEFPDFNLGNQEHSAYFIGPSLHYGGESYWWTLTVLPQIYGRPNNLGIGSNGKEISDPLVHLGQHERLEVRVKFGIPFGTHSHH